ncbi:MAG: TPM domain-containing protein, partial [Sphingopyxis sp.]|nr:TPM domain-containing protein [Sphingopyxis sp.]
MLSTAAAAQDFPKLSGRVVDQAELLPPADEAALTDKLAAFEARSKQQVVVATVASLNDRDISDYGTQLGRAWGIGAAGRNDGVLFLIAPNERKM